MPNNHNLKVIAITGTIGSGKSTVGQILEEMGIPVIDTDKLVHQLLAGDTPTRKAVVAKFGAAIQKSDGSIDRTKLGPIVFKEPTARKDLEAIVHPAVIFECRRQLDALAGKPIAAVLVPLLFESGLQKDFDQTWTIFTEENVLRKRLASRDHFTPQQLEQRLSAQWSQDKKKQLADRVVDNSGTTDSTRRQVATLIEQQLAVQ